MGSPRQAAAASGYGGSSSSTAAAGANGSLFVWHEQSKTRRYFSEDHPRITVGRQGVFTDSLNIKADGPIKMLELYLDPLIKNPNSVTVRLRNHNGPDFMLVKAGHILRFPATKEAWHDWKTQHKIADVKLNTTKGGKPESLEFVMTVGEVLHQPDENDETKALCQIQLNRKVESQKIAKRKAILEYVKVKNLCHKEEDEQDRLNKAIFTVQHELNELQEAKRTMGREEQQLEKKIQDFEGKVRDAEMEAKKELEEEKKASEGNFQRLVDGQLEIQQQIEDREADIRERLYIEDPHLRPLAHPSAERIMYEGKREAERLAEDENMPQEEEYNHIELKPSDGNFDTLDEDDFITGGPTKKVKRESEKKVKTNLTADERDRLADEAAEAAEAVEDDLLEDLDQAEQDVNQNLEDMEDDLLADD